MTSTLNQSKQAKDNADCKTCTANDKSELRRVGKYLFRSVGVFVNQSSERDFDTVSKTLNNVRERRKHSFNHITTSVTEADIASELYTKGQEDPDLIVRSAGELRLSNFLTWQSVYSELYFSDTLWPDFGKEEIDKCVKEFYSRSRRFGGLDTTSETNA